MAGFSGFGEGSLASRTLDALVQTTTVLKTTVEALRKSVDTQATSLSFLTETVFGREDPETLKHIPGLRDRITFHETVAKWGGIPFGVIMLTVFLHDIGVPTQIIGQLLIKAIGH